MKLLFDCDKLTSIEKNLTDEDKEFILSNSIRLHEFHPNSVEELHNELHSIGFDETNVFDGRGQDYITACIGIDMLSGRAVYDFHDMVTYLIEQGMNEEDTFDWIYFNTIRSLPYFKNSPIVMENTEQFL